MRCVRVLKYSEPPPLPLTHPPNPFGSGMASPPPRGTPMKFTTFHQHHQLVAHPQQHMMPPTNGVTNGNNSMYQTQTIHVVNQQHFVVPQPSIQPHYHQQQQQFFDIPASSNYVSNNTYSRMSAPLGMNHFSQQQSPRTPQFWNQQQQYTMRNDFNGNTSNIESG